LAQQQVASQLPWIAPDIICNGLQRPSTISRLVSLSVRCITFINVFDEFRTVFRNLSGRGSDTSSIGVLNSRAIHLFERAEQNLERILIRKMNMNTALLRVLIYFRQLTEDEQGQDLVEYSLIVALIAFGAMSGMRFLSTGLNHAFSSISSTLTTNV
jgi:pilus assembly protein Flp/PilA